MVRRIARGYYRLEKPIAANPEIQRIVADAFNFAKSLPEDKLLIQTSARIEASIQPKAKSAGSE